jgi:hypothetical protein
MIRRSILKGLAVMALPGTGGLTPPANAPRGQALTPGVQPGTTGGVQFARVVVVFGPTGAVNGVFVYQPGTRPGTGNGPVLSGTEATADLYGNPVEPGWVSYAAPGSAAWAQLGAGQLNLNFPGMTTPASVALSVAGQAALLSGDTSAGDSPAGVQVTSKNANGGSRLVSLVSDKTQLTASASADLPLAHLAQFPISGAATLATTIAAVNALYAALVTAQVFAS